MAPITRGVLLALVAAAAFGGVTPLVQLWSRGADPPATAALLYLGAAAFALLPHRRDVRLTRQWAPRVVGVAVCGAFVAPLALAAGLGRTDGTTAALLLNLEAAFTVLLGGWIHREPLGPRVLTAVVAIGVGGALVAVDHADGTGASSGFGAALVALATLAWAVDNVGSRPLSEFDPSDVVAAKGSIGAALSLALALALGSTWPAPAHAAAIAACGAFGFGASLRLYLRAQRVLGAARTGSVFAVAPFLGVVAALALGQPFGTALTALGAALVALGAWLHLGEQHDHPHEHPAEAHDHPHTHDDGHHDHVHDPPVAGRHSHVHDHGARTHTHPHGEDLHHRHH